MTDTITKEKFGTEDKTHISSEELKGIVSGTRSDGSSTYCDYKYLFSTTNTDGCIYPSFFDEELCNEVIRRERPVSELTRKRLLAELTKNGPHVEDCDKP